MKPTHTAPLIGWTPALRQLKALFVKRQWAWLIVNGCKDIENRSWATNVRGPVLTHAGAGLRARDYIALWSL